MGCFGLTFLFDSCIYKYNLAVLFGKSIWLVWVYATVDEDCCFIKPIIQLLSIKIFTLSDHADF